VRIAAKCGLKIDPDLLEAMKEHKNEIFKCSKPRLLEETFKLVRGGHAEKCIHLAHETEILDVLFPELLDHLDSLDPEGEEIDVFSFLKALDRLARRNGISDAVVQGALLSLPVLHLQERTDPSEHSRVTTEYLMDVAQRIGATKRMTERLRQIFSAQRSFPQSPKSSDGRRSRRRLSPSVLIRRSYFQDALDLFEIHTIARGLPMDDVKFWREKAVELGGKSDGDKSSGRDEDRRSKGRKRRRRRRKKPSGSEE
jgi:poly(A) polymerase